jgi:hypothetical protein
MIPIEKLSKKHKGISLLLLLLLLVAVVFMMPQAFAAESADKSGWLTLHDPSNPFTGAIIGRVGPMTEKTIIPFMSGKIIIPVKIALDTKNKLVSILYPEFEERNVQTWNYEKNIKISDFKASKTGIKALVFNPVSGELITGGDGIMFSGPALEGVTPPDYDSMSDDPNTLLRAWNPLTGKLIRTYPGTSSHIWSVSVSPDGHYVAATEGDQFHPVRLLLWQADGVLLKAINTDGKINYGGDLRNNWFPVSFSPDGHHLTVRIDGEVHSYMTSYDIN